MACFNVSFYFASMFHLELVKWCRVSDVHFWYIRIRQQVSCLCCCNILLNPTITIFTILLCFYSAKNDTFSSYPFEELSLEHQHLLRGDWRKMLKFLSSDDWKCKEQHRRGFPRSVSLNQQLKDKTYMYLPSHKLVSNLLYFYNIVSSPLLIDFKCLTKTETTKIFLIHLFDTLDHMEIFVIDHILFIHLRQTQELRIQFEFRGNIWIFAFWNIFNIFFL